MAAPPLTHATIFRLALPIVPSNATVPLRGAVILATLSWCFGFLRITPSGLFGTGAGGKGRAGVSAVLIRALLPLVWC